MAEEKNQSDSAAQQAACADAQAAQGKANASVIALFTIVVLAASVGNFAQTAVNAMLATIAADVGVDVATGQWLTTSFMLVVGITVPISTYLSRRVCIRTHILIGLALLAAGTLVDLFAADFALMLVGRILQAASVGVLLPLMQNVAVTRFPPKRRGTAMGIAGIALGFAPNIGPTIGGAMNSAFGWRSFFLLALALAVVLAIATIVLVRAEDPADCNTRFEMPSFILSTVGFGGVLMGFSQASSAGIASPLVWVPLVLGCVVLVVFFRRQAKVQHPIVNLAIFANADYVWGTAANALVFASFLGVTLIVPLFVQNVQGGTSMDAGIILLPATLLTLVANPLAGIAADKFGTRAVTIAFSASMLLGSVLWMIADAQTPAWSLMVYQSLRIVGTAGLIGPLQAWSLSKLKGPLVPDGSSVSILVRQAAASFGTALMVLAISLTMMVIAADATELAYHISFGVSAVFALLTFVCVLARIR